MRKFWSVLILFSLLELCNSPSAIAQWRKVGNFGPSAISCIYFLDKAGASSVGFIGASGGIYRTVDGGLTWKQVMSGILGAPTNFTFKDARTGWCSMGGSRALPAIYRTIDGGQTWTPLSLTGDADDVYYNMTSGILCLSIRSAGIPSVISTNDGISWTALNNQINQNGFAFCSPSYGILSAPAGSFYQTVNGGKTWTSLNHIQHSWSPCAIPNSMFYVSAQDQGNNIFISTTAGQTWGNGGFVPSPLTGCVRAGSCAVYVQAENGIYESSNIANWSPMGGPGNTYDTRFYVTGTDIYAGDVAGNVWAFPAGSGNWPSLRFEPSNISLTQAAGCKQNTALAAFQNLSCIPLTILNAAVSDSLRWILAPSKLPVTLQQGDSLQLHLIGLGQTPGTYQANLHLLIQTQNGVTDTTLPLKITLQAMIPPTLPSVNISVKDQCTALDTNFRIHNNHCDTIKISSLAMLDSSLFEINAVQLPIVLAPDSDCTIPLRTHPSGRGTFRDTVSIQFTYANYPLDTIVPLRGTVNPSGIQASLSTSHLRFDTVFSCDTKYDTVYLHNTSCDSVTITEQLISLSSPFQVITNNLNKRLGYGDSIAFVLALPGANGSGDYNDELDIMLDNDAYQQQYSLALSGMVRSMARQLTLSTSSIVKDSIPPCQSFDTTFFFTATNGCDSILTVTSAAYNGNGNVKITANRPLPTDLGVKDTLQFTIHYDPLPGEAINGSLHLTSALLDTIIPLHVSVKADNNAIALSALKTTLVANYCGSDTAAIALSNHGCSTLNIDSISLVGGDPSQFTTNSFAFPITLRAGADTTMSIVYHGDAPGTGSITFVAFQNGRRVSQTISGSTIPVSSARLGIAAVAGSSLQPMAGATVSTCLYFADIVAPSASLQSLRCKLRYDDNVLTLGSINGLNGWNIQQESAPAGTLSLLATRNSTDPISPKDALSTFTFTTTISDSLWSPITLNSVTFSPDDATYERCILASGIEQPNVDIHITTQCGDSLLSTVLRGEEPGITSIVVRPNPVGTQGEQGVTVSFKSQADLPVTATLMDMLGRQNVSALINAKRGANTITLPITNLSSGFYYVELRSDLSRIIRQVQVLR